uniref:Uncharacterized protein n=1 Tax=Fagus sylvatica TaxID=28930 RepID=A0A2N9FR34_FAGSY
MKTPSLPPPPLPEGSLTAANSDPFPHKSRPHFTS